MLKNFIIPCKPLTPLFENEKCKITPVTIARDGMQLKPGGLFDESLGEIVGLTVKALTFC